jgi:DNA-binding HxlR family transcriptional regulator
VRPRVARAKAGVGQLRALEADGVVARTAYPEVPPRVEYALTPAGEALCPALDALHDWAASEHLAAAAPAAQRAVTTSGAPRR